MKFANGAHVIAIGPSDVTNIVARCASEVAGCVVKSYRELADAAQALLVEDVADVLVIYIEKPECRAAARELILLAQQRRPATPVVVIAEPSLKSDFGDFLACGVADCLVRPLNLSRLTFLIDFLTLRPRSLPMAAPTLTAHANHELAFASGDTSFVAAGSQTALAMARRLSQVDSTILLSGETGSGKSSLARVIHQMSARAEKPFVVVNCGAIPESLLESELFGHQQGAFTGADRTHRGKFAQAEDGTIFLDEIDSLSLASQSCLLRVVEDRCFEAVGSGTSQKIRARLVFATNRDLDQEVKLGRFRADLYYRLNVISVAVPALRERPNAIAPLAEAFLKELRAKHNTRAKGLSAAAVERLQAYHWPGNVRELRNVFERLAVFCEKPEINVDDLPEHIRLATNGAASIIEPVTIRDRRPEYSPLSTARRAAEREQIVTALTKCRDNRSRAAEFLGISRTAFYKKLHQFGLC
jgi:DNA-binding NtrC family response regulator